MNTNPLIIDPDTLLLMNVYLPDIRWFRAFKKLQSPHIWYNPVFQRQELFSRAYFFSKGKPHRLSIPVQLQGDQMPIPDYSQSWVRIHKGALQSLYGKAPYFEYIAPLLFDIYDNQTHTLWSLNQQIILLMVRVLGLKSPAWVTTSYSQPEHPLASNTDVLKSAPSRPFTDNIAGLQIGNEFDIALSTVHLLFHKGPESSNFL